MENIDLFEYASRRRLRVETNKGNMAIEDLWSMPLEWLNSLAKNLNKKLKDLDEEDFIEKKTKSSSDTDLEVTFEIVKKIISVKLDEKKKRLEKAEKDEKKRRLVEALERARDRDLESKSPEELEKMINELTD